MQGRDAALLHNLAKVAVGDVVISIVTLAEVEYGLARKGHPPPLKNALEQLPSCIDVLPGDETVARCFCELCAALESPGVSLSDQDMMITNHGVEPSKRPVNVDLVGLMHGLHR